MALQHARLEEFLVRLEAPRIFFKLGRTRQDCVLVEIAVPGERWEVEFGLDGDGDVEISRATGPLLEQRPLPTCSSDSMMP